MSLGSTFVDNLSFFQVCLEALSNVGRKAVVSLSNRLSPAQFEHVPPNVELTSFVAQKEILQRAALFVTHGGGNSVYEALYCATPMIVIPQITEQSFYARQIAKRMLGAYLEPKALTAPLLRSTVLELMDNDQVRRNVQALKDTLPLVPPAVTACDGIEEFARTSCIELAEQRLPRT